jgi:hypothetical protein
MADEKPDQASDVIAKAIEGLMSKHGQDAMTVMRSLQDENYKLREKNRTLKQQFDDAEKKAPAEGSVVLSKADAERWEKLKALGKPEEVEAAIKERDALKTEVAGAKRDQLLRDVSEVEGWNFSVVKKLAGDLSFEILDTTNDKGETRKSAMVLVKNGDSTEKKSAANYAETEWKDFLPSLKVGEQQQQTQPHGTKFVKQPGAKPQAPATRQEVVKQERDNLLKSGDYAAF